MNKEHIGSNFDDFLDEEGINVSGCQQLVIKKSGKHYCYDYFNGFCEDNKDCLYKQFQRLKAEEEELSKIIDCKNGTILTMNAENQRLKAENDGLKSQLDFEIQKRETVEAEKEGLKIKHQRYRECSIQLNQKLKQALEEVRKSCTDYAKTEAFVIDQTFVEFLENVFIKIREVLEDEY